MAAYIINNSKPDAVTVDSGDEKTTHPNIKAAWAYVDGKREEEQLDMFPHHDAFDEERMDRIGQNGNDGAVYDGFGAEWLREAGLLE